MIAEGQEACAAIPGFRQPTIDGSARLKYTLESILSSVLTLF